MELSYILTLDEYEEIKIQQEQLQTAKTIFKKQAEQMLRKSLNR